MKISENREITKKRECEKDNSGISQTQTINVVFSTKIRRVVPNMCQRYSKDIQKIFRDVQRCSDILRRWLSISDRQGVTTDGLDVYDNGIVEKL